MFRFLLRSIGFIFLAAALAAVIVDGTRSIAAQRILQFSLGETLHWLAPTRLGALQEASRSGLAAARPLFEALLSMPTWGVTAVVGSLLMFAGRRPRPKIGYSGRL